MPTSCQCRASSTLTCSYVLVVCGYLRFADCKMYMYIPCISIIRCVGCWWRCCCRVQAALTFKSVALLYNIQHAKLRKKENYSFSTSLLFSRTGSRGEGVLSLAPHRQHERKRRSRTNPYRFKITKCCDRIFKIMFVVDGFCSLVVA